MPVFEVGDDVRQLDRVYERTLYGYVLEVWAERGLCLVQWGRSDPVTPATPLPHTSWEENCELLLERRGGEESPIRTFTQEEKDWILQELAKTDHDNYIVGALVKEANQVTTKKSKEEQMIKIIYSALLSSNHSDVKNFRNDVLGYVPENGYLDIVVDHGTFRITVEKSFR